MTIQSRKDFDAAYAAGANTVKKLGWKFYLIPLLAIILTGIMERWLSARSVARWEIYLASAGVVLLLGVVVGMVMRKTQRP